MINFQELKKIITSIDENSAIFYLFGGIGDKLMYLSQAENYQKLFNCNIILCSKEDTSESVVGLFPELIPRHLILPKKLYDGYSDEAFMLEICDKSPGIGKIFCTWCVNDFDNARTQAWMKKNDVSYNIFRLVKHQLSLPSDEKPNFIKLQNNDCSIKFEEPYVFLCPLANSVKEQLPFDFWAELIMYSKSLGYECVVNAIRPPNHKLYDLNRFTDLGCKFFFGDLKDTIQVAKKSAHTVTVRSGIADLFSLTHAISYSIIFPRDFLNLEKFFSLDICNVNKPTLERLITYNPSTDVNLILNDFFQILKDNRNYSL